MLYELLLNTFLVLSVKKVVKALTKISNLNVLHKLFVNSSGNKNCLWEENIPLEDVPESIANVTLISAIPGI